MTGPRLAPLTDAEMSPEQLALTRVIVARTPHQNVYRTVVRNPAIWKTWTPFARYLLSESAVEPRDRELAILRVAWLCRSTYEWAQHLPLARAAGLDDVEIARVRAGSADPAWSAPDADLLRTVERLHADYRLPDADWAVLAARFDEAALMDLIFIIGHYHLVAMVLNAFAVPVDDGLQGF